MEYPSLNRVAADIPAFYGRLFGPPETDQRKNSRDPRIPAVSLFGSV